MTKPIEGASAPQPSVQAMTQEQMNAFVQTFTQPTEIMLVINDPRGGPNAIQIAGITSDGRRLGFRRMKWIAEETILPLTRLAKQEAEDEAAAKAEADAKKALEASKPKEDLPTA